MKTVSLVKPILYYLACAFAAILAIEFFVQWDSLTRIYPAIPAPSVIRDVILILTALLIVWHLIKYHHYQNLKTAENYDVIFRNSLVPFCVLDKVSLRFLAVNEAMLKLYGYSEKELLSLTGYDILSESQRESVAGYKIKFGNDLNNSSKWVHQKKSGELFHVDVTSHMIPLFKSEAYLVMIFDIDKSSRDEKRIDDLVNLYETVNAVTNDVVWDYDLVNDQLNWQEGYGEIYGYSRQEALNSQWDLTRIHPEDRSGIERSIEHAFLQRDSLWHADYRYLCADGSYKYVRDRGRILFNENGHPVRMIGAMQDVDQQVISEQQLLLQNKQLKDIAWLNSHAVRRPLSNILGLISLLKHAIHDRDELLSLIDMLESSSKDLDQVLTKINDETVNCLVNIDNAAD
ncbi:PAS domain-containing protein [Pedobacter antarcticus]|uniref:PAS domain-containing protein n=1 Tax=Pedobacter antarcticus TaxID=34086 RepID=UPI001C59F4C8|nr:PAS domain-containing protein [Pedobacter antarcticus]